MKTETSDGKRVNTGMKGSFEVKKVLRKHIYVVSELIPWE